MKMEPGKGIVFHYRVISGCTAFSKVQVPVIKDLAVCIAKILQNHWLMFYVLKLVPSADGETITVIWERRWEPQEKVPLCRWWEPHKNRNGFFLKVIVNINVNLRSDRKSV